MEIDIDAHDTRVLLIHPKLDRPQLVGTSRHITGAWSILDLGWDTTKFILSGTSETVSGDTYTLFIYVPREVIISGAKAMTEKNFSVPVKNELTGNLLKLSFQGQSEKVRWQVQFKPVLR